MINVRAKSGDRDVVEEEQSRSKSNMMREKDPITMSNKLSA